MAKGGKLTKLKSVLKKMQSFKLSKASDSTIAAAAADNNSFGDESFNNASKFNHDLHQVYVGKSRRLYLVRSEVIGHPLFRELVERSGEYEEEFITVGCEVVMFEHLLWMLENADHDPQPLDDHELVEFYAC